MMGEFLPIGIGLAVMTAIGAGFGIGIATGKTSEAISRQPEAASQIRTTFLIGAALSEATAIYGLVIALMLLSQA
jgi:F-type H+-transporting ATPase subunit c